MRVLHSAILAGATVLLVACGAGKVMLDAVTPSSDATAPGDVTETAEGPQDTEGDGSPEFDDAVPETGPEQPEVCQPDCTDAACGDDGCGGICGVCDDELECTSDGCVDRQCSYTVTPGWCLIDEECFMGGASEPTNPCLICYPLDSPVSWSELEGVSCEDGGVCFAGECCHKQVN